jgi:DNA-binding beta-propeller fold protein YncE
MVAGCATAKPTEVKELVWPLPPEKPRIRYIGSYSNSDHFKEKDSSWLVDAVLGAERSGAEGLGKPFAVAVDARGRIYVTDTGSSRLWVFDPEKKQVRFLGESGQGALVTPSGVTVDDRGVVFVSDTRRDRVFGYDETGKVVMEIGKPEEFYSPAGLAIDRPSGRLYVADAGRHKIRVYESATGQFLFEFGQRGVGPGEFNYPTHLFMRKGTLYVSDTMNFRVQTFTPDGKPMSQFGQMGAQLGQLARPKGVAVDSDGHVYVVDAAFGNFQIFEGHGEHQLMLFVGQTGSEPGQFMLPAGVYIDEQDRIYVADQYNRRVQVFQYFGDKGVSQASGQPTTTGSAQTSPGGRK